MADMTLPPRPYLWEKSYPPGVRWDFPLRTGPVSQVLDAGIAAYPEHKALTYGARNWTYRQTGDLVARAAAGLQTLGVGRGTPVALYLPNTPWHPVLFFAVMRLGGIVVHLSPLDAERELAHKLRDSGARIVATTDLGSMAGAGAMLQSTFADAGRLDAIIVGEDAFWREDAPDRIAETRHIRSGAGLVDRPPLPHAAFATVDPATTALFQFTGGTTGIPKAAALSHANLSAACEMYRAWAEPQNLLRYGAERTLMVLPLFHIYGLTTVLMFGLSNGAELVLHPRFDVETVLDDIETRRITQFPGVPTMWIAVANSPGIERRDLSSLRIVSSGGAACPIEIEARIGRLTGKRLGGGWGMTETAPAGTRIPLHKPAPAGTIGLPVPGLHMDVVALNDPRRRLGIGEVGEIRVSGPNVIAGYHNRPEENADAFVDGYLLTGDMGYMDEDGFFFIVDRKKDMITSGGFNVYPRVVEEAVYEHPAVAECIAIGVPDTYRGAAVQVFVALKPGAPRFTLEELRAFLADKIGRHEMPAHLEIRDALPRTPVGKLSKKALIDEARGLGAGPDAGG